MLIRNYKQFFNSLLTFRIKNLIGIYVKLKLINKYNDYSKKFENKEVPRPNYWVGIKIIPIEYEFWEGGEFRMHKREVYFLRNKIWKKKNLSP